MDYEKKYKEAVNKIKNLLDDGEKNGFTIVTYKTDLESIFPELKESEDEEVRKSLIILLQHFCKGYRVPGLEFPVSYKDMLAWLEKQDEVESYNDDIEAEEKGIREAFNKIENEKQCKKPQRMISAEAKEAMYAKSAEWSEEDEKIFNKIIRKLDESDNVNHYDYTDFEMWLIDLKERLINI